jgi:hypothetical protein
MNCPRCGETLPYILCPECKGEIPEKAVIAVGVGIQ